MNTWCLVALAAGLVACGGSFSEDLFRADEGGAIEGGMDAGETARDAAADRDAGDPALDAHPVDGALGPEATVDGKAPEASLDAPAPDETGPMPDAGCETPFMCAGTAIAPTGSYCVVDHGSSHAAATPSACDSCGAYTCPCILEWVLGTVGANPCSPMGVTCNVAAGGPTLVCQ
jgi:hypothetical protein